MAPKSGQSTSPPQRQADALEGGTGEETREASVSLWRFKLNFSPNWPNVRDVMQGEGAKLNEAPPLTPRTPTGESPDGPIFEGVLQHFDVGNYRADIRSGTAFFFKSGDSFADFVAAETWRRRCEKRINDLRPFFTARHSSWGEEPYTIEWELDESDRNGIIAPLVQADLPVFAEGARPETPGRLAESLRVLAEQLDPASPALDRLRVAATEEFLQQQPDRENVEQVLGALSRIAVHTAQVARLRREIDDDVRIARDEHATWSDIARASGVTPQAARRRWDADARKRHSDYERDRKRARGADSEQA